MSKNESELPQIDELIATGIQMVRTIRALNPLDERVVEPIMDAFNTNNLQLVPAAYHLGLLVLLRDDCRIKEEAEQAGPSCPGCDGQCDCGDDCEHK